MAHYSYPMFGRLVSAILCVLICPSLLAQTRSTREQDEVREALANFVVAFDNLDWETFRLAFSDDATVFYPRAFPERANGRAEFEKTFKVVFDQIHSVKLADRPCLVVGAGTIAAAKIAGSQWRQGTPSA